MCWNCNSYLDGVTIWCENNRMKMNIAKTKLMILTIIQVQMWF